MATLLLCEKETSEFLQCVVDATESENGLQRLSNLLYDFEKQGLQVRIPVLGALGTRTTFDTQSYPDLSVRDENSHDALHLWREWLTTGDGLPSRWWLNWVWKLES